MHSLKCALGFSNAECLISIRIQMTFNSSTKLYILKMIFLIKVKCLLETPHPMSVGRVKEV